MSEAIGTREFTEKFGVTPATVSSQHWNKKSARPQVLILVVSDDCTVKNEINLPGARPPVLNCKRKMNKI